MTLQLAETGHQPSPPREYSKVTVQGNRGFGGSGSASVICGNNKLHRQASSLQPCNYTPGCHMCSKVSSSYPRAEEPGCALSDSPTSALRRGQLGLMQYKKKNVGVNGKRVRGVWLRWPIGREHQMQGEPDLMRVGGLFGHQYSR